MVRGVITLDGEDIGNFKFVANEQVEVSFSKIDNNLADVLEFAAENGMTVALELRPLYDDHMPQHRQDIPSPK